MTPEQEIEDLKRRVERLERFTLYGVGDKNICPVCNINWTDATGYVCGNQKCPIQHKVTC